eukprot:1955982-Karenia_brevis.AAC.1
MLKFARVQTFQINSVPRVSLSSQHAVMLFEGASPHDVLITPRHPGVAVSRKGAGGSCVQQIAIYCSKLYPPRGSRRHFSEAVGLKGDMCQNCGFRAAKYTGDTPRH